MGFRQLSDLKTGGRWSQDHSVKRYQKGGRIAEVLHRLDANLLLLGDKCPNRIGSILCGTSSPLLDVNTAAPDSRSSAAAATSRGPGGSARRTRKCPAASSGTRGGAWSTT